MSFASKKYMEEELVRKISLGDQKAFEKLYHLFYKRLCQFAFLFLHSKEISEEVVSDVFLNIWIKQAQLAPDQNIRSYLYTSVRHQTINYLRTKPVLSHDHTNIYELEIESPDPSVDDMIDRELFRQYLQQSFDRLPERCRIIARMHFNDQLPYKEIAEILDISRKTVEAQIAIAIRKIKDTFEKFGWNR